MKFRLVIECNSEAFEEVPSAEVARILRELAGRIDWHPHFSPGHSQPVSDINGNEVGGFVIEDDEPPDPVLDIERERRPGWQPPDGVTCWGCGVAEGMPHKATCAYLWPKEDE
jgi:hypothetical protein